MLRLWSIGCHTARVQRIARLTEAATKRVAVFGQQQSPPQCREVSKRRFGSARPRWQGEAVNTTTPDAPPLAAYNFAKTLPVVCPGCGGMSQTIDADVAGYYSLKKRNVQKSRETARQDEDNVFEQAMARLSGDEKSSILPTDSPAKPPPDSGKPLLCDRCHGLIYQSKGQSILHPSMQSIRDIIESSPHRDNHIYHVLDAADFPMSLIPNLVSALDLPRLRTQNRRSKSRQFIRGRTADVSFIITRSDLLAPRKEDVDRMMPYLQEVLRDALGRAGKNLRLGNVRCVSAKRGWWTPHVKEQIWKRGGAGWVVGKVNVGKSALFEVVYPKGRSATPETRAKLESVKQRAVPNLPAGDALSTAGIGDSMLDCAEVSLNEMAANSKSSALTADAKMTACAPTSEQENVELDVQDEYRSDEVETTATEQDVLDEDDDADISLLPPAQEETAYPHMPIVSSLPGTTASPIRIPFGNGKGELIDLPGIQRTSMETHIKPEHRASLVMKSRIVPEQFTLHSGRSLLLGGIIRITPKTDDLTFLLYPFTPLTPHAARNDKAIAIQTGFYPSHDGDNGLRAPYDGTIENIGTETAKKRIISAGTFKLEWDATRQRTGSLTDRSAGKRKVSDLPFVVYSADILIEGVGWVEIACQVRNRRGSLEPSGFSLRDGEGEGKKEESFVVPEVEVFTPKGKFIGVRRPMNAWMVGGPKKVAKHAARKRPRMSVSFQKRVEGGRKGSSPASGSGPGGGGGGSG